MSRVEPVFTPVVKPGLTDLGQDPGQQETVADQHDQRNHHRFGDEASSQGKVDAAGGPATSRTGYRASRNPRSTVDQPETPADRFMNREDEGFIAADVPAIGPRNGHHARRGPENEVDCEDQQRQVVAQARQVAQGVEAARMPCSSASSVRPRDRVRSVSSAFPLSPLSVEETKCLASRPGHDGDRDQPRRPAVPLARPSGWPAAPGQCAPEDRQTASGPARDPGARRTRPGARQGPR